MSSTTFEAAWPDPFGLCMGLLSVAVGQAFTIAYHYYRREHSPSKVSIQKANNPEYEFWEGVTTHLAQPEGFVLLGGYLVGTWMFNLMPASYYSLEGPVNWGHVLAQLLLVVRPTALCLPPRLLAPLDSQLVAAKRPSTGSGRSLGLLLNRCPLRAVFACRMPSKR